MLQHRPGDHLYSCIVIEESHFSFTFQDNSPQEWQCFRARLGRWYCEIVLVMRRRRRRRRAERRRLKTRSLAARLFRRPRLLQTLRRMFNRNRKGREEQKPPRDQRAPWHEQLVRMTFPHRLSMQRQTSWTAAMQEKRARTLEDMQLRVREIDRA